MPLETYPIVGGGAVHRFDTGTFNWYVIEQGGRLTLVDAGFPGHYSIFRRGIAALGRSMADLEAIVLTHAHADHMGFMERLRRETGVPIFVHEADGGKRGAASSFPGSASSAMRGIHTWRGSSPTRRSTACSSSRE